MSAAKVMPVELSMHAYQGPRPSSDQLFQMSFLRSHHCPQSPGSPSDHHWARVSRLSLSPTSPGSTPAFPGSAGTLRKKKKKRVVFADDKGLALTAVRFFTADPPGADVEPPGQCRTLQYRLGFPQPSADPDGPMDSLVKLETCRMVRGAMLGKVRVRNIGSEKVVHVRVTFDSWRSHHDIQCIPMHQADVDPDTELFLFTVSFPTTQNLQDRLEFRVSLRHRASGAPLWDDNAGQNYRILVDVVDDDDDEEVLRVQKKPLLTHQLYQSWPARRSPVYGFQKVPHKSSENLAQALNWKENISP